MDMMGESIKKLILAGVGSVAMTTEKGKEILDELVKKGELTVEQGKMLNMELKHNMKETVKDKMNMSMEDCTPEELFQEIEKLTPDQLANLKAQIQKVEAEQELSKSTEEVYDMEYLEEE